MVSCKEMLNLLVRKVVLIEERILDRNELNENDFIKVIYDICLRKFLEVNNFLLCV